jgi:hypothetical protein
LLPIADYIDKRHHPSYITLSKISIFTDHISHYLNLPNFAQIHQKSGKNLLKLWFTLKTTPLKPPA